ncbi:MAG: transcription antitermination factor NusB [Elusimicrobia bacterium CG08_land_8_20_14_0_20_51_18]|nr:MAG: transcription antitermination factor NusB [Elusimicrobia bacterium CG08_land_8_20_14_0_20_51_18]
MKLGKRRIARINCVVSLYLYDVGKLLPEEILACYIAYQDNKGVMLKKEVYSFYENLFKSTINNLNQIDTTISEASKTWDTTRLFAVDRSILRMATCEMAVLRHASVPIVINEAVEIAKAYSPDEFKGPKFINGVLDTVAKVANLK